MDMDKGKMREILFEIIKNQIHQNDPPQTETTYNRLKSTGMNDVEVKQLIGQALIIEIFDTMKNSNEFNVKRYVKNLSRLPKSPLN